MEEQLEPRAVFLFPPSFLRDENLPPFWSEKLS